ncbi:MAG: hypothetical protein ACE1ZP_01255, partial [Myxococcota bacterium]
SHLIMRIRGADVPSAAHLGRRPRLFAKRADLVAKNLAVVLLDRPKVTRLLVRNSTIEFRLITRCVEFA